MTAHERRAESRQLARESLQWFEACLYAALLTGLVVGAAWLHAWVSRGL